MGEEKSALHYEMIFQEGGCCVFGKDENTGEEICFKNLCFDKKAAEEIVFLLNKNKVSLCHAKDVIRDFVMEKFEEKIS